MEAEHGLQGADQTAPGFLVASGGVGERGCGDDDEASGDLSTPGSSEQAWLSMSMPA